MQPSTSYYSPRYPTMIPSPQSTPITHSSNPQPHYPHPQYPTIHHHHHHQPPQPPQPQPQPQPHHQYVYPSAYPQSPYLCLPNPSTSPTHSQYPIQQLHLIPPYMPRPQIQAQPMQQLPVQQYVVSPKETPERDTFYAKLHAFREEIGEPIQRLPTLGFKELDLWVLYKEVTKRKGIDSVIAKKQWKEVAEALQLPSSCTDSGFRLRLHYKKYLEAFERKFYRPPPTKDMKKEPKKLQRACSVVSTDSTYTQVAGENSGSSGTASPASAPGSSSDSMVIKRITKKKRRAPSSSQADKSGSDTKKRTVMPALTKSEDNTKSKKKNKDRGGEDTRIDKDKAEAQHNLRVLEAAVMAVDEEGRLGNKKKKKKVDFSILDNSTLKRYAKAYDMCAPSSGEETDKNGKWKRELAESVSTHFSETPLVGGEHETLLRFIQAVRRVE